MMDLCIPLKIDIPLLKPNVELKSYNKWTHTELDPANAINFELYAFLVKHNLKIYKVEVFYTPANHQTQPHVDGYGGDLGKINWVFGGQGSVMRWYNITTDKQKQLGLTDISTDLIVYEPNEVTLIHQQSLESPSIVQVGIPHNVKTADQDRWCVSLILHDPKTGYHISVKRLKELLL